MRILIISDIHGNMDALKKVVENENFDEVWFLGDFTDYGPEPHEVYDYLRDLDPEVWIMGNHDYANAFGVDCRCGEKTHELSVYTRENVTQRLLDKKVIDWMRSIPIKRELSDEKFVLFVHGCPRDPLYGYMTQPSEECMVNEIGRKIHADLVIYGHTHLPVNVEMNGIKFVNPGSAGQPRDGDFRASYAIYDTESGEIHLKRVKYDVEKVIEKIKSLKLERRFEEQLIGILRNGRV